MPQQQSARDLHSMAQPAGEGRSFWLLGDLVTFKITGKETGEAFALLEVVSPPGGGPPPHVHHRETESFYVLEGELSVLDVDRWMQAPPGTFVCTPRGALHTFKNVGTEPARFLVLVTPAGLENFVAEMGEPAKEKTLPPPVPPDMEKLLRLCAKYGIELQLPARGT